MKPNLYSLIVLGLIALSGASHAASALRRLPLASRPVLARTIYPVMEQRIAINTTARIKQGSKNSRPRMAAAVAAASLGLGLGLTNRVYAHEEAPNNLRLKYNDQTHKYQLLEKRNGQEFCFDEVSIPQELRLELRQTLQLSGVDPDTITIIGLSGQVDGNAMSVLTFPNGQRIITLNLSLRSNDTRFTKGFNEIQRIFGFYHEAAHIKKQHNSKEKSLEQEEVEADVRAMVTMRKHEATKEKLQQKMQYLFLKNSIYRPNIYLSQFEELYYGLQILKNPEMSEQQEQELVNRVLQDRKRPNHQMLIQNAVYRSVDAGELKVTEDVLNKELSDTKASSIRTAINVGLVGWGAAALLSVPAYVAFPPLALLVPTVAGINYYSETFFAQKRYDFAHQKFEQKNRKF